MMEMTSGVGLVGIIAGRVANDPVVLTIPQPAE